MLNGFNSPALWVKHMTFSRFDSPHFNSWRSFVVILGNRGCFEPWVGNCLSVTPTCLFKEQNIFLLPEDFFFFFLTVKEISQSKMPFGGSCEWRAEQRRCWVAWNACWYFLISGRFCVLEDLYRRQLVLKAIWLSCLLLCLSFRHSFYS